MSAPAAVRRAGRAQRLFDPRPVRGAERSRPRAQRRPCSEGEQPTLERRLAGAWEGLLAAGAAACPVCGGPMHRHGEAGRCGRCGARLS